MPSNPKQYQRYLRKKDIATYEFHVEDRKKDIEERRLDIEKITTELENKKNDEDIKKLNEKRHKNYEDIKRFKDDLKKIHIWEAIRYSLSRFGFVDKNSDEKTVWEAYTKVRENYVEPLYKSLEGVELPYFLKKVGLTDALIQKTLSKRIFHLIERMINEHNQDNFEDNEFSIPYQETQAFKTLSTPQYFKTLNTVLSDWVNNVLSENSENSENLSKWNDPLFQVYLGYETLYIYLRSIGETGLANNIEPLNFYNGICHWLQHTNRKKERQENIEKSYDTPIDLQAFQWTKVLDELHNPITDMALFSKAIHSFLGENENGNTQNPAERDKLLNTIAKEIEYLKREDVDEILEEVLKGKKAFEEYAKNVKPDKLGKAKRGNTPEKWYESSLFCFWGHAFCKDVYSTAQKIFAKNSMLLGIVRDVFVKPLTKDNCRAIENYLEGGRSNPKVNEIMALIDKATLPVFREIWQELDKWEFNAEQDEWELIKND
jgi:hypothetical protein